MNVINMNGMFSNCASLKILNILNLSTASSENNNNFFDNCISLKYLICADKRINNILK